MPRKPIKPIKLICAVCGKELVRRVDNGRPPKYCDDCRQLVRYRYPRPTALIRRTCKDCGKDIVGRGRNAMYCVDCGEMHRRRFELLRTCKDCGQMFIAVIRSNRCMRCASARAETKRVIREARYVAEKRYKESPEQATARRRQWRVANLERARAQERERSARKRHNDPEPGRAASRRYHDKKRRETVIDVEVIEQQLMERATKAAVTQVRRERQRAAWQAERLRPKPCAYCGEIFTAPKVTTKPQIYCGSKCRDRAHRLGVSIMRATAAGRL